MFWNHNTTTVASFVAAFLCAIAAYGAPATGLNSKVDYATTPNTTQATSAEAAAPAAPPAQEPEAAPATSSAPEPVCRDCEPRRVRSRVVERSFSRGCPCEPATSSRTVTRVRYRGWFFRRARCGACCN